MKNQFEKHIHDAMSNHEAPVSDSVWASIQQKQSKTPLIYYISRISVACLILFLGFFAYTEFNFSKEEFNTIVVEQKQITPIEYNLHQEELKQLLADIPAEPIYTPKHDNKRIVKPEIHEEITIPEKEVIVLTIKPKQRNKRNSLYNTTPQVKLRPQIQVDSEILLTQIEENLNVNNKRALESYLTDIKKLASKNSINNKIQTAQNWINKTASDFGITNKKNKDND